jgi:hypothetical protein
MRSLGSVYRGLRAMRQPYPDPQPGWAIRWQRGWWLHYWTPTWHEGRGPYLSMCIGIVAIYRGY